MFLYVSMSFLYICICTYIYIYVYIYIVGRERERFCPLPPLSDDQIIREISIRPISLLRFPLGFDPSIILSQRGRKSQAHGEFPGNV